MSLDYASALSEYENKGVCGIPEVRDPDYIFEQKVSVLTDLLRHSSYTVVHTGAGLSTAAGIPDFRGPNGVWTLEKQGKKPAFSKPFTEARPSVGHMALVALERAGYINFVITQNIDGLHLRSGFPRNRLSILHGDVFMEKCGSCGAVYIRSTKMVPTFGLKPTGARCTKMKTRVRPCGGKLRDSVLDWEDELPEPDYAIAVKESRNAQLHLSLGVSPQIFPSVLLPFRSTALGAPRMHCVHRNKHENSPTHSTADPSFLASFETLLTTNSHITNSQIDEFLEWYLASGASLPKGNEMLSSVYLAPPQSFSKHFKWTRHAARDKSAATAASSGRKRPRRANLQLCIGTSLQIHPAADLPFTSKQGAAPLPSSRKRRHPDDQVKLSDSDSPSQHSKPSTSTGSCPTRVVIVNLQPTKFDARADICLRAEIDRVLTRVCQNLGVEIPIVENEGGVFIPKIVLRSKHTTKSERFPWIILSHPENKILPFASNESNDGKKEEEDQTADCKKDKFELANR
ncbi:NAD dependent deacetylase sirtuin 6 [Echinococcus multilocularis]|uniref:protein acetyllysine N-acetyltransferase n=1 Tax=Echinococcus multilocularis TaxID=6211 RepID=A0A068Y9G6_ECHMU|nr:NAD dependent deacetylase sirtuin 6 [Echinococcus multilocularis]